MIFRVMAVRLPTPSVSLSVYVCGCAHVSVYRAIDNTIAMFLWNLVWGYILIRSQRDFTFKFWIFILLRSVYSQKSFKKMNNLTLSKTDSTILIKISWFTVLSLRYLKKWNNSHTWEKNFFNIVMRIKVFDNSMFRERDSVAVNW